MERECEVWAIADDESQRDADLERFGHDRHVCVELRHFGMEHDGKHRCSCGFQWPHKPTDNGDSNYVFVTRQKIEELKRTLRSLKCVQAGWAFGVPEDGRDLWLDLVAEAIMEKYYRKEDHGQT